MVKIHLVAVVILLVTILNVIDAQKKDKYAQKIKIENEDERDMLSENPNVNLPQKHKIAAINKMIKAAKLDVGPKKINQKDFKQNRTNVEFIKRGNKTIVLDKDTNSTIEEIPNEEFGHQNWYWWG